MLCPVIALAWSVASTLRGWESERQGAQGLAVAGLLGLLSWLLGPLGNIGIYGYFLEGVRMFQCLLDFKF